MAERIEYRVRWRRAGGAPRSALFQTERGAVAKCDRLLDLDRRARSGFEEEPEEEFNNDGQHFLADLLPLDGVPVIECREVGPWRGSE